MAIKALNNSIVENFQIARSTTVHAGQCVATDNTGLIVLADRANWQGTAGIGYTERYKVLGLCADDAATTGNTFITNDPVGSTFLVGTGFSSYANGWYVGVKRDIGDFQDEAINAATNLTQTTTTGNTQRGVGVYLAPGEFITDQVNLTQKTSTNQTDAAYTTANATPGLALTVGAGSNKGTLIVLNATGDGPVVAILKEIVDSTTNAATSLCIITLV